MSFNSGRTTGEGQEPDSMEDQAPVSQESPLNRIYSCRYRGLTGCSFTGSPQELSAHYRREHKGDRQLDKDNEETQGTPPKALDQENPFKDLVDDLPTVKSAINISRWKGRLKIQDPGMFKMLFPAEASGEAPGSIGSKLVDLQMADYIRSLTEKTEAGRQPQLPEGPYEEVDEYIDKNGNIAPPDKAYSVRTIKKPIMSASRESSDVRELKEKVENLTQQLENQRFEGLKSSLEGSITSLRNEIKANENELKTLIVSAKELASEWIAAPGPVTQIVGLKMGLKSVIIDEPPTAPAPEGARDGIIDELKKHGYVGKLIEKEKT